MIVKAKIRNEDSEWIEEFVVPDDENPEEYIKTIVDNFNATLRPYEKSREFVEIVQDKDISEWQDEEVFKKFNELLLKWIRELSHENSNAYGSAWVKHNFDKIVKNKYNRKIIDFINDCPISIEYTSDLKRIASEVLKRGWRKYRRWIKNEI